MAQVSNQESPQACFADQSETSLFSAFSSKWAELLFHCDTFFFLTILECLLAVVFFAIASDLISFDFTKFFRIFCRWSPDEVEFRRLNGQIAEISKKMAPLSPVSDFAQYFKLERTRNKLVDERNATTQKISRDALLRSFKVTLFSRLLVSLLSMLLVVHIGSQLTLLRISSVHFYPCNFLLRFPSSFVDWFIARDEKAKGTISISLFNFLLMALFVRKVYVRKRKDLDKKAA